MENLRSLWTRAWAPRAGFAARAQQAPSLGEAFRGLILVRTPPALLASILGYLGFAAIYGRITRMEGPLFDYLWANLPDSANPADLKEAFQGLPPAPSLAHVLPWLALLAPIWVLSLWLHDAVWDHASLWLLRGLKTPKSFRVTLVAEAEVLKVGAVGAVLDFLGALPVAGWVFQILLFPLGVYFWIMRGYALAAWHGCPVWKGVVATLLHAALAGLFALVTLGGLAILVLAAVRPG